MTKLEGTGEAGFIYRHEGRRAHPLCKLLRQVGDLPLVTARARARLRAWAQALVDRGWRGELKFVDYTHNVIPNVGRSYYLDAALAGGTQINDWALGVTDAAPTVDAADTMASHAGWSEEQGYSEATRPDWVHGAESGQSIDNVGNEATFTSNANGQTWGGSFLVGGTGYNTKGGTSGTLMSVAAFTQGDKAMDDGETIDVTATMTMGST